MSSNYPAPDNHHTRRRNSRNASDQKTAAAGVALQRAPGRLDRKPPCNFAHGRKQWQSAGRVGNGLIGDCRAARPEQAAGLIWIRRQMKVRKEDLSRAKLSPLHGLRFFHLYDHLRLREYISRRRNDRCAHNFISKIRGANTNSGPRLNNYRIAGSDSGSDDYLVTVAARDIADYEHIHKSQLSRLPHVFRIQSNFALRNIIDRPALPTRGTSRFATRQYN
jgi:DNA-binding Lrp family transcriptional regulator